jgi:hypothetical protein
MAQGLAGPGQNLPPPQALYPSYLANVTFQPATNAVTLSPGQALPVPANPTGGTMVNAGSYGFLQWFNPVTLSWEGFNTGLVGSRRATSDGFNYRVANMTGCPVAAIVTNSGTATYVEATTSVTPSTGGSTWNAIVGGLVNTTVASVTSIVAGGGYTIAPLCFIPSPPPPGYAATAVASISSNSVSTITMVNQGAGYPSAPPLLMLPSPYDPNFIAGSVTYSSVTSLALTGAGLLSGVICINSGTAVATMPSLAITGAGSGAVATVVPVFSIASTSIAAIGAGFAAGQNGVQSFGGIPTATATWRNPLGELTAPIPRAAQGTATLTGTTITSIVPVDSGLFFGTPTVMVLGGTTLASIVPTMGGVNTTVYIQPT